MPRSGSGPAWPWRCTLPSFARCGAQEAQACVDEVGRLTERVPASMRKASRRRPIAGAAGARKGAGLDRGAAARDRRPDRAGPRRGRARRRPGLPGASDRRAHAPARGRRRRWPSPGWPRHRPHAASGGLAAAGSRRRAGAELDGVAGRAAGPGHRRPGGTGAASTGGGGSAGGSGGSRTAAVISGGGGGGGRSRAGIVGLQPPPCAQLAPARDVAVVLGQGARRRRGRRCRRRRSRGSRRAAGRARPPARRGRDWRSGPAAGRRRGRCCRGRSTARSARGQLAAERALALGQAVDHGRVGLQRHAASQPVDEHRRDQRVLRRHGRLLLDDRGQDQRLRRASASGRSGRRRGPGLGQQLAASPPRIRSTTAARGSPRGDQVGLGQQRALGRQRRQRRRPARRLRRRSVAAPPARSGPRARPPGAARTLPLCEQRQRSRPATCRARARTRRPSARGRAPVSRASEREQPRPMSIAPASSEPRGDRRRRPLPRGSSTTTGVRQRPGAVQPALATQHQAPPPRRRPRPAATAEQRPGAVRRRRGIAGAAASVDAGEDQRWRWCRRSRTSSTAPRGPRAPWPCAARGRCRRSPSDGLSRFKVGGTTWSRMARMQKIASTAPAAPSRWPIADLVEDIESLGRRRCRTGA